MIRSVQELVHTMWNLPSGPWTMLGSRIKRRQRIAALGFIIGLVVMLSMFTRQTLIAGQNPVLSQLERPPGAPGLELIGIVEDLGREANQRASTGESLAPQVSTGLVEPLENALLVTGLKTRVEEVTNDTDRRVVAVL